MMIEQLANGLEIVGEPLPGARAVALGFWVRVGARDEVASTAGVSHFLEHMAFKGTEAMDGGAISRALDALGARSNAWTSDEETVYHAMVLPDCLGPTLDLLGSLMRPALRETDCALEKKVILEEIAMAADRPSGVMWEQLRAAFYGPHPLGNSILGTPSSVGALEVEALRAHHDEFYGAANITLVACGAFEPATLVSEAHRVCARWAPGQRVARSSLAPPRASSRLERRDPRFEMTYAGLMAPGFDARDATRLAAATATLALGGGESSRLHRALVDTGIAAGVSLSHDASTDAGAFYAGLRVVPERAAHATQVLLDQHESAKSQGLSRRELDGARGRLASALALSAETPLGRFRAVGQGWLARGELQSWQQTRDEIAALSDDQINAALDFSF